jgi:hypothetical protein
MTDDDNRAIAQAMLDKKDLDSITRLLALVRRIAKTEDEHDKFEDGWRGGEKDDWHWDSVDALAGFIEEAREITGEAPTSPYTGKPLIGKWSEDDPKEDEPASEEE